MCRTSILTLILMLGSLLLPKHAPAPVFGFYPGFENLCENSSIIAVVKSEGRWPTPRYKAYLAKQKEREESPGKYPPIMHVEVYRGGFLHHQVKLVTLIKGEWPEGNPVVHLRPGIGWLWYYTTGYHAEGDYLLVFFEKFDKSDNNVFVEDSIELEKNLYQNNETGAISQIEPGINLADLPKDDPAAAVREILSRNIEAAPPERKEAAKLLEDLYLDPEKSGQNVSGFLESMDPSDYIEPKILTEPIEFGSEYFPAPEDTIPKTKNDQEVGIEQHSISYYPSSS